MLEHWQPYISEEEFNYLVDFVEKTKNNIHVEKCLVLLGSGGNGKTTLINQIVREIGQNSSTSLCFIDTKIGCILANDDALHLPNILLYIIQDFESFPVGTIKRILMQDTLIGYGYNEDTSKRINGNVIVAANSLNVDEMSRELLHIIYMDHKF
jgi:ABC-type proline/glycine betaine transport system ATPase subunit